MASLDTIYRNQLGRAPDPGGLAHYQAQIAGGRSIDDIRQEIANSPEAKSRGVGTYASPEPKYTQILNKRGGTGLAGSDTLPIGRGQHSFYASLGAAAKKRGDLFSGSIKDRNLSLLEGYSFTGGKGKVLVDTIGYRGNDTNPDGTINIYKDAPVQKVEPKAEPEVKTEPQQQEEEVVETTPDYGQQIADAMAAADKRMEELMNQFKIQQDAAEERQRLAAEADRQKMLTMQRRDRAAGRTPNLQIRGAGETPSTAGTQGFRRRSNQFRIAPFQGLGGIASQTTQSATNKMVNI